MGLTKCPRCELNYILDGGSLCTVCRKEVRGESEQDEIAELCSECGENPVIPGSELCASCMKEMTRHIADDTEDDVLVVPEDATLEIDSVSTMDEIAIDIGDDIDGEVFDQDDDAFKDDEDEDEDKDGDLSTDELAEKDDEDDDDDLFDR